MLLKSNVTERKLLKDSDRFVVYFSVEAWHTARTIVQHMSTEVAWRTDLYAREPYENDGITIYRYDVNNIYIPSQEVTTATVESTPIHMRQFEDDFKQYCLDDDNNYSEEIYVANRPYIQGYFHSHVNMAASPSSVDTNEYKELIEGMLMASPDRRNAQLFGIMNKRDELWLQIFDPRIDMIITNPSYFLDLNVNTVEIFHELKDKVKTKPIGTYSSSSSSNYHNTVNRSTSEYKPGDRELGFHNGGGGASGSEKK